jgi:hypothetical protein
LIPLAQAIYAVAQSRSPRFEIVLAQGDLGVDQGQGQLVAETQAASAPHSEEVHHLQSGHTAAPGEKAPARVELWELLPEDQADLLKHVLRVAQIAYQRVDVGKQRTLMRVQQPLEPGQSILDRRRVLIGIHSC